MLETIPAVWQVVGIMVTVAAAAVWLRSSLVKQRTSELTELADTRGKRIEDLETEVRGLETRLAKLEGMYAGLQALKVAEIADEVVNRLSSAHFLKEN